MRALRKLNPGDKGPPKKLAWCVTGNRCSGVRYRYDVAQRKRFTTVELIVEEADWSPPEPPAVIGVRVEWQAGTPCRIKQAGGEVESATTSVGGSVRPGGRAGIKSADGEIGGV
ncbi:MAG: hypothetical protein U0Y68_20250 [Blastocatellia bacterium]